jgi:hypothetical protein
MTMYRILVFEKKNPFGTLGVHGDGTEQLQQSDKYPRETKKGMSMY